jgi:hypothetical protein
VRHDGLRPIPPHPGDDIGNAMLRGLRIGRGSLGGNLGNGARSADQKKKEKQTAKIDEHHDVTLNGSVSHRVSCAALGGFHFLPLRLRAQEGHALLGLVSSRSRLKRYCQKINAGFCHSRDKWRSHAELHSCLLDRPIRRCAGAEGRGCDRRLLAISQDDDEQYFEVVPQWLSVGQECFQVPAQ